MAEAYSTGSVPAFLSSIPIQPAVIRSQLYFQVADVLFASFIQAATGWAAAEAHRLDIAEPLDTLIVGRSTEPAGDLDLSRLPTQGGWPMVNADLSSFRSLPEPHGAIYVEAKRYSWGIAVEYRGPSPAVLLAAGYITQRMLDNLPRGKRRVDEEGNSFGRYKQPTQAEPERCAFLRMTHADRGGEVKAMSLAGVAESLRDYQQPEREKLSRDQLATFRLAQMMSVSCEERTRAVGRFRRAVTWLTAGDLILPDRPAIKAYALIRSAGGRHE